MANNYDRGDRPRMTATFQNSTGGYVDPTTVVFKALNPGTNAVTQYTWNSTGGGDPELVRDSLGIFHVDIDPTNPGRWYYRFEGTGSAVAAEETYFGIRDSKFY